MYDYVLIALKGPRGKLNKKFTVDLHLYKRKHLYKLKK